jgi:23S rRNA pseudouridine2605 synthase
MAHNNNRTRNANSSRIRKDSNKKTFVKKEFKQNIKTEKEQNLLIEEEKERSKKEFFAKPKVQKNVPTTRKSPIVVKSDENTIRLNKYIANSGVCSRREADEHIKNGLVTINGKVVTDMGTKVSYDDIVKFNNKQLNPEKKIYILLNKPKDYVTTLEDKHAAKTVMDLIEGACTERVYPVGRLDKNTTGVLLLTNDGDLTKKLTHPSYKKKKIYHVFLDKNLKKNDFDLLAEGFELEDGFICADTIQYIDLADKTQVGVEIHSGKNRIVRRMFEHLGYDVVKLDRVYFAGLTKKNLSRGKWRFLTEKEVGVLKMGAYN